MAYAFDYKKRLGSGFFGEVWLVIDIGLKARRALKLIQPDKIINQDNFFQEAQILKAAEHPNVVKVFETGKLRDGGIYISMEYLKKGSLEDESSGGYVQLTKAKKIMIDILRGLEHLHSKNIIHRDIKPSNILIGGALEGKLSDFGLSLPDFSKISVSSLKDHHYYLHLAPEVNKIHDYTHLSDIYSCGVTLYRLVNGDSYLPHVPLAEVRISTKQGTYPNRKKYRDFVPPSLKKIINKAMNINPKLRYTSATEMRHALEQLNICMNWNEKILPNGMRWSTGHGNICYELLRIRDKRKMWKIEVRKGRSKKQLRHIRKFCSKNLSKIDAERKSKKLLQDFVTGKES